MLRVHDDTFTPELGSSVGRLLSAALSPMSFKADPEDAKEALHIITTEVLPWRRQRQRELTAEQLRVLQEQERQLAADLEEEATRRVEQRARMAAQATPLRPPPRQKRNNLGYMYDA